MAWEQADRYLTGIGGTRNRRLIAQQLLTQAQALANHRAQQQAERGISIAAAGMVGTSNTASGAVSGGGAEHTIVELTADNDEARKALAAADRHMAEALTKLRTAVEIWAEYARLAHTADEIDITPGLICQPTWQALRVVVPAHVREFKGRSNGILTVLLHARHPSAPGLHVWDRHPGPEHLSDMADLYAINIAGADDE